MKKKAFSSSSVKLESSLQLFPFMAHKVGLSKPSEFSERFGDIEVVYRMDDGYTNMYHRLESLPNLKIPIDKLRQYDSNIQEYVKRLCANRDTKIFLKYFQYMAALFTEIYLDEYFRNPVFFQNKINDFPISGRLTSQGYSRRDLRKIAFWMATGSGKTLLMHINYWQFMRYNKGPYKIDLENIILVTQTSELSSQHLNEMRDSGINAEVFQGDSAGYFSSHVDEIRVKIIDIYKLKLPGDKKGKGEGVTIDVSDLSSKNLVFVDEGHKGHSSDARKWKKARQLLAQDGFTLEYSATFGQAIDQSNEADVDEYAKSIIFVYSYKYFFKDGYGKDFQILNVDPAKCVERVYTPTILLANTLAFYEQKKLYDLKRDEIRDYNLAKPLWMFVGQKVQEHESDILTVVEFFEQLLSNRNDWASSAIQRILNGRSGIIGRDERDVFELLNPERNFAWLRAQKMDSSKFLDDVLHEIFYVPKGSSSAKLRLVDLRNTSGEIGLRVGNSKIFGMIDIGNKSEFLNYVKANRDDIIVENDAFSQSLFKSIESLDSTINILIGAKKFIEGWNTWRVSSIGLLNVGQNEGPQIIQLFGRGVRLKGRGFSLKRSRELPPPHPQFVETLETLSVYGIKASYMETFRKTIEKEEVSYKEMAVDTKTLEPFPSDLQILRLNKSIEDFYRERTLFLQRARENTSVTIDLLPRVSEISSTGERMYKIEAPSLLPKFVPEDLERLIDWDLVYHEILKIKRERGWFNLLISPEGLHQIISEKRYQLYCDEELMRVANFGDMTKINDLIILVLTKYIDRTYRGMRKRWERDNIALVDLNKDDPSINKLYTIEVEETDAATFETLTSFKDSRRIYGDAMEGGIKNMYFEGHLFQPLLQKLDEGIILTPNLLNEGEAQFVHDLREHMVENKDRFATKSLFLMRNLSRGGGIGFMEEDSFYPDFILWIKDGEKQFISFIDPKGLIFFPTLDDFKFNLFKYLQDEVSPRLGAENIFLNSFILSVTSFSDLKAQNRHREITKREEYEERHIFFQKIQDNLKAPNYITKIFSLIYSDSERDPACA